jgi:hypothetical protein
MEAVVQNQAQELKVLKVVKSMQEFLARTEISASKIM